MTYNSASLIIFREAGRVAFVLRANTGWRDGFYGLPGGKVEPGENFTQAAIREAKEEVGVDLTPANLTAVLTSHLYGEDDTIWANLIFEAHDWPGEPYNAEPAKCSRLDWLELAKLPDTVIPVGKYYLDQIAAGNHYVEYGWPE